MVLHLEDAIPASIESKSYYFSSNRFITPSGDGQIYPEIYQKEKKRENKPYYIWGNLRNRLR